MCKYQGVVIYNQLGEEKTRFFQGGEDHKLEYATCIQHHARNLKSSLWVEWARDKEGLLGIMKKHEEEKMKNEELDS